MKRAFFKKKKKKNLRSALKADIQILQRQLQKRLAGHSAAAVVHGRGELRPGQLLCDLGKGGIGGGRVGGVGGDANGGAAAGLDVGDDGLVAGGLAGEEDDGVGFGEAAGEGGACAGADTGDDCEEGRRGHFVLLFIDVVCW